MPQKDLDSLRDALRRFAEERDWDQFHSPKNLSMALAAEAGELLEQLQWLTEAESADPAPKKREALAEELADVFIYLVRLADKLDIDLYDAAFRKVAKNATRYPAERVRGSMKKYTEYD